MSGYADYLAGNNKERQFTVFCNSCNKKHMFRRDDYLEYIVEDDDRMYHTRIYTWIFEDVCNCGNRFNVTIEFSEYPPGSLGKKPHYSFQGCRCLKNNPLKLSDVSYSERISVINPPRIQERNDRTVVLDQYTGSISGNKTKLWLPPRYKGMIHRSNGHVGIRSHGRLFDILVEDTCSIDFKDNRARFAEILIAGDVKQSATKLLGRVAEAVIVRRCRESILINKVWMDKARYCNSKPSTVERFQAIGTGLDSTKRLYRHKYNYNDTQRDIIWVDSERRILNIATQSTVSVFPAGLQVKVSHNGINYVLPDLRKNRYEVPVVYFGLNNDFEAIVEKLQKPYYTPTGEQALNLIRVNIDFLNAEVVDPGSFQEVMDYYPIISRLFEGTLTADDFVKEATGTDALESSISSIALGQSAEQLFIL